MSDLNLENIVGFKAVDKDGNEQNVTVDEMVDMVSTRMVMALSETSTFAAAAATGNDVYENELPTVTDAANVRVLQSSGDAAKMTMQSLASKLGGLIGIASCIKDKGMKVVDANETPMNEFIFAYIGSTNLPTDSSPGGLLTLGFMDGSSSCKLQFFFRHDNVFKRIQWYNNWQNWTKILTE
jgi:hypothetical protein